MAVAVVSVPVKKRSRVEHSRFSSWKYEPVSPLDLGKKHSNENSYEGEDGFKT